MSSTMPPMSPDMLPALKPPPGILPNFENPLSLRHRIVTVSTIFPVLAALFVAVRIYTRAFITRAVWWDDYTALVTLILSIATSAIIIAWTNDGFGIHQWDVRLSEFSPYYLKRLFELTCLFAVLPALMRTSLCLLYWRIFDAKQSMRWAIYFVMGLNICKAIVTLSINIWRCSPRAAQWDITLIPTAKCIPLFKFTTAALSLNVLEDLLVLVLPIPGVLQLHLPKRQKIGVLAIFMTGMVAVAIGIARLIVFVTSAYSDPDLTWATVNPVLLSIVEVDVGLICACAPVTKPFLRRFFPSLVDRSSRAKSSKSSENRHSHSNKSWTRMASQKRHPQQSAVVVADSSLELGEGGKHHTLVQGASLRNGSEDPIIGVTADGGHIVKTVSLDIA
ncbi:MAG: histone deacetylase [Watsoniomyces obsoletus]|nr:MAG: histone deacetylase [Watsoniomyces obsoletus]